MDTYIVALDVFLKSFHQYFIYYFNSYTHIDFSIAPLLVEKLFPNFQTEKPC